MKFKARLLEIFVLVSNCFSSMTMKIFLLVILVTNILSPTLGSKCGLFKRVLNFSDPGETIKTGEIGEPSQTSKITAP